FLCYSLLRYLLSFPTRRSSDLLSVSPFCPWLSGDWLLSLVLEDLRKERPCRFCSSLRFFRYSLCHRFRFPGLFSRLSQGTEIDEDRKSTRLNSSHEWISYAVFC